MDQGCAQGLREVSIGGAVSLFCGTDHCGRWRQSRHCEADEGLGSGVLEIALPWHGDAFRDEYAVQLGSAIWVIHAFQKKAKQGIKTPQHEIELIEGRLKRLKEALG